MAKCAQAIRRLFDSTSLIRNSMNEPKIIFENADLLVVDKPAGVLVHPDSEDVSGTMVEWFLSHAPEAQGVGEPRIGIQGKPVERSGVVHRLDRETSGLLLMVKNQKSFEHVKAQFQNRLVRKEYRTLVYGLMKERWGTIDRPIGRSARDWRLRSAERGARGMRRDASTDWECLIKGTYEGEAFSYLKLLPKTGRTHQLRVHLKAIGRPIVGDLVYAGQERVAASNNLGIQRLALHAHYLQLVLPSGEEKAFISDIPPELVEAIDRIAE